MKGIMDRMDWDREVEVVGVEEEEVAVVIFCNAMHNHMRVFCTPSSWSEDASYCSKHK